MKIAFCFSLFIACVYSGSGSKLPSDFPVCRRSDKDLNGCLKQAIEKALIKLQNGIPSLGVPPIEPLQINSLTFEAQPGSFNVEQKYTNLKVHDLSRAKVDKVDMSLQDKKFKFLAHVTIPTCRLESNYDFNGRLMTLPITGSGKSTSLLKDVESDVEATGEEFQKKGETYIRITDLKIDMNPKDASFTFENLFGQDEALSKEMAKLINENWKELYVEVKPGYEEAVVKIFKNIMGEMFSKVPLKEIFPE